MGMALGNAVGKDGVKAHERISKSLMLMMKKK